nr:MAG TPA: hypothetical protein [Bacteriophage sp.]
MVSYTIEIIYHIRDVVIVRYLVIFVIIYS